MKEYKAGFRVKSVLHLQELAEENKGIIYLIGGKEKYLNPGFYLSAQFRWLITNIKDEKFFQAEKI